MSETRVPLLLSPSGAHESLKAPAESWFRLLRERLCAAFEEIEAGAAALSASPVRFQRRPWLRPTADGADGGGGEMSLLHGAVFEKAGINISVVGGEFSPEFRSQIPGAERDGRFWAAGLSLVAHPRNPYVPAAHLNTRLIITTQGWFGGAADITPMLPETKEAAADAARFHAALRIACDRHDPAYYPRFCAWCERYFFLPHRGEARGLGGIFFDDLDSGDPAADFAFVQEVGYAFLEIYPALVRERMSMEWTPNDRERQLIRRGRYAEFNLLYDRGTIFGLRTGGNPDAILMSLPPEVRWP